MEPRTTILGLGAAGIRTLTYLSERSPREVSLIGIDTTPARPKAPGLDHRIALVLLPPADGLDETGFQLSALLQQESLEELLDEDTSLVILVGDLSEPLVKGTLPVIAQVVQQREIPFLLVPVTAQVPPESTLPTYFNGLLLAAGELSLAGAESAPPAESTLRACADRLELLLEIYQPLSPAVSIDFQDLLFMLKKGRYFLLAKGMGAGPERSEQALKQATEQLTAVPHPALDWKSSLILLTDGPAKPQTIGEQRKAFMAVKKFFTDRGSELQHVKVGYATDESLADRLSVFLLLAGQPIPRTEA
ncbi:hypothetical protein GCM10027275_23600 [Rhabdobacter roseus]|uniref:Cell division GTPase FtsZ n=1 Tax=Rhabdobacter roseus TaxID=1655419 RepID=A0A840TWH5_9BACT|nr:hypothetical protein [Rhabdobacter roseus]MBB5284300.1 cell division GTPase FtsZ [Rhabdobacter roseus]